jgi:hypothetical protein
MKITFTTTIIIGLMLMASIVWSETVDVNGTTGNDATGERGNPDKLFNTIPAGIDVASEDDTVLIADGTYINVGNSDFDFKGKTLTVTLKGKALTVLLDKTRRDVIEANLDRSYVTAFGGLPNPLGSSHIKLWDLILEAELNQHVHLFEWRFGMFKFTPKVRLRFFNGPSNPVKTPGYLPRVTYFHWFKERKTIKPRFYSCSFMFSHHSNGQSGPFFNPDGTINTDNGSFDTNFIEVAGHRYSESKYFDCLKLAYQIRLPSLEKETDDILAKLYWDHKVILAGRLISSSIWVIRYKLYNSISLTKYNEDFKQVKSGEGILGDNIALSIHLNIKLPLEDISFLLRYDYGFDYYNINFWQRLNRWQIGIFSGSFE